MHHHCQRSVAAVYDAMNEVAPPSPKSLGKPHHHRVSKRQAITANHFTACNSAWTSWINPGVASKTHRCGETLRNLQTHSLRSVCSMFPGIQRTSRRRKKPSDWVNLPLKSTKQTRRSSSLKITNLTQPVRFILLRISQKLMHQAYTSCCFLLSKPNIVANRPIPLTRLQDPLEPEGNKTPRRRNSDTSTLSRHREKPWTPTRTPRTLYRENVCVPHGISWNIYLERSCCLILPTFANYLS